jgi:hypothetical protein
MRKGAHDRKPGRLGKILLGAAILLGGGYLLVTQLGIANPSGMLASGDQITTEEAGTIVKDAYTAQGDDISVVSVSSVSDSMYEVALEMSDSTIQRAYLTKDGEFMTTNPINASDYTNRARERQAFLNCLRESNVQIHGNAQNQATLAQLQILGGVQGLNGIYFNLNQQTLQQFVQQGVQQTPVIVHNETLYQGAKSLGFLEEATGCDYSYSDEAISLQ